MAEYECGQYKVEIYSDECYSQNSADNVTQYQHVYFSPSEYRLTTVVGIKVYLLDNLIGTAVVGAFGGATGIYETQVIVEEDRVVFCCSDSVFCLSVPDLKLLWETKAAGITCFEIYTYEGSYIMHGEMEISRLNHNGEIMWQQGGKDIFTGSFCLHKDYILAKDWNHTEYKISYDGVFL